MTQRKAPPRCHPRYGHLSPLKLSPREIEHDNPESRRAEEMREFLGQLYNREVTDQDTVTVIRFSEIRG